MAKKPSKLQPLTLSEIILRGDAETIRQALEARTQIDTLLAEREAAYQRIAELETQVEDIIGEEGIFPFPEPPMPVADFVKSPAVKKAAAKTSPQPKKETAQAAAPDKDSTATESNPASQPTPETSDASEASDTSTDESPEKGA